MDLLALIRSLRRHKLVTVPVILLTALAAGYFYFGTSTTYQSTTDYLLVNPTLPTDAQLEHDPHLANLNRNNPYLNFSDQSTVTSVLSEQMMSDSVKRRLEAEGADARYTVAMSNEMSAGGRQLAVIGTGPTPQAAVQTTSIVGNAIPGELRKMQTIYGAAPEYLIRSVQVQPPSPAISQVSGKLRSVIMILIAGVIVLFTCLSVAQAMSAKREENRRTRRLHQTPLTEATTAAIRGSLVGRTNGDDHRIPDDGIPGEPHRHAAGHR